MMEEILPRKCVNLVSVGRSEPEYFCASFIYTHVKEFAALTIESFAQFAGNE